MQTHQSVDLQLEVEVGSQVLELNPTIRHRQLEPAFTIVIVSASELGAADRAITELDQGNQVEALVYEST